MTPRAHRYTVYGGTHEFLVEFATHWGIQYTLVDATDPEAYRAALKPNTRVVYTESPANPTCRLTDLEAVSAVVDDHVAASGGERPLIMCDSTFATPYHQRCLEIGVDVAIHSATKYIGGHSDILAGAVTSASGERGTAATQHHTTPPRTHTRLNTRHAHTPHCTLALHPRRRYTSDDTTPTHRCLHA